MKVPPTNNSISGFDSYEEEVYFPDGSPTHAPVQNGVDDYPPVEDSDFSEYMWMENEEEFDKEVMQRLEEEELMEQCILQHMLEDERSSSISVQGNGMSESDLSNIKIDNSEMAKISTLNPHAAEFVPSWRRSTTETAKSS